MSGEKKSAINYWPEEEHPHNRLINYGSGISNEYLRGTLIDSRGQCSKKNVVDLSQNLLSAFGTLEKLNQATGAEICKIKAIGVAKAKQIKAPLEMGKRMASKTTGVKSKLKFSHAFVEKFFPFLKNLKKEILKIVFLEPKLQLIKDLTISKGSLNVGIMQPRKVMNPTIRAPVTTFTLIHNHPSGKPTPSPKYFEVTDRLNQTKKIIGIDIVDHIIIGVNGFFSFADEGLL
jgi:DNA repair protein RadC